MKKKFYICFVMAKENIAFRNIQQYIMNWNNATELIWALHTRQKIQLKIYTLYTVAETQRHSILQEVSSIKFYSFLIDGSIDASSIENELIVAMYFGNDDVNQVIGSRVRYISLEEPVKSG